MYFTYREIKMVEFDIRIHPQQRVAYIPRELFAILSSRAKAVPNRSAVLMFSQDVSLTDILQSLDIIKADLLHAQSLEQQKGKSEP